MPLNNSGPISIGGSTSGQSINLELGRSATAQSSLNESALRTLAGVPSGQISLSDFYGKSLGGQVAYTTPGIYTFTVPTGVTSISVLCIGGGQGAALRGGSGGDLAYVNNYSVTPGDLLTVQVGGGGQADTQLNANMGVAGGHSRVIRAGSDFVFARGGNQAGSNTGTAYVGGTGDYNGGGGAAGYSGNGGKGGYIGTAGSAGTGGGSGGGGGGGAFTDEEGIYYYRAPGGGGGGTGILGEGSSGGGGTAGVYSTTNSGGGGGGSGGSNGSIGGTIYTSNGGSAGSYGGGGGGAGILYDIIFDVIVDNSIAAPGAGGAVRIMWGGGRSYPSNAGNV